MLNHLIFSKTDFFFCLILAIAFSASPYYIRTGFCSFNLEFLITAIYMFAVFLIFNIGVRTILFYYFSLWHIQLQSFSLFSRFKYLIDSKNAVYKIELIMLLLWLPLLMALYPGTLINDTWGQLQQFIISIKMGDITQNILTDQHPIFDTLFMGLLIIPIVELTGNWHIAIFIYVLFQALLTSLAFSYSILYIRKKLRLDEKCVFLIFLLYCVLPIYATSVQTVSKDALFSWIFVLFFIHFMEMVHTYGMALDNKKFFNNILLTSIFCALTKKVAVYVIIFSFLATVLAGINNRRKILVITAVIFILMAGIMPAVLRTANVQAGGIQEMFSIPFQQTARYVKDHPQDITQYEKEVLSEVLDFPNLAKKYNPLNADPVKDYYQKAHTIKYWEYLKVWFVQLLRHPFTYMEAFNAMVSGWFSFSEYNPLMNMDWHNQLSDIIIPHWVPVRPAPASLTANALEKACHSLYNTPIFGLFLSYGFYAAIFPAFVLSTTLRTHCGRHVRYYLVSVPMVLSLIFGCWLAPVSIHFEGRRYLYPLTYTAPLLLAWCMFVYQNEINR